MYADINGLQMFCETRGTTDPVKVPVVPHGAISATGTLIRASAGPAGGPYRSPHEWQPACVTTLRHDHSGT